MNDQQQIDGWWREVLGGRTPADWQPVQARLVRAVARAALPSGPVFVKVMSFPRAKDRLRYLLRPLPLVHEAAMLERAARAGLPVPAVVAVRAARTAGLPRACMLVLRALPVVAAEVPLHEQAALALAMLRAGVLHRDLHAGNFVATAGGPCVLDLQSAGAIAPQQRPAAALRVRVAARLWQDRADQPALGDELLRGGLLVDADEVQRAHELARRRQRQWQHGRLMRALQQGTSFTIEHRLGARVHRRRGPWPTGRWLQRRELGGRDPVRVWLQARAAELRGDDVAFVHALRRPWLPWSDRAALWIAAGTDDAALRDWLARQPDINRS